MTTKEESGVTQDMKEAAEKDLKRQEEKRKEGDKWRTFTGARRSGAKLKVSDLYEFPAEFDVEGISPAGYLAQPDIENITGTVETQRFSVREERLKGLMFDEPGRSLEKGRGLRTIKALKPTGVLTQIPFEDQINNQAAGDMSDAVGLKKYERKGYIIFYDATNMRPIYCMARNCWAAAMIPELIEVYPQHTDVVGSGYCSFEHFAFTEPNSAAKRTSGGGMFDSGATTTKNRGY